MNMNTILLLAVVILVGAWVFRTALGGTGDVISIAPADYETLVEQYPGLQWLDVRTSNETANGKMPNTLEADVMSRDFSTKLDTLAKDQPYLVYCRSGQRSLLACRRMQKAGFTQVFNLKGGYQAWERKG